MTDEERQVSRVGGVFGSPKDRTGHDVQDEDMTMPTRKKTVKGRGSSCVVGGSIKRGDFSKTFFMCVILLDTGLHC